MTMGYPAAHGVYIPTRDLNAQGNLISFTRDPKEFMLNEYIQYVKTEHDVGKYLVLDPDNPARIVNKTTWEDGQTRPEGNENTDGFEFKTFRTKRHDYPVMLGDKAVKQAEWGILAQNQGSIAQQGMTERTQEVITILTTGGNWGSNTDTANSLNGGAGTWNLSTSDEDDATYNAIEKAINAAIIQIMLATNSKVKHKDLVLVLQPDDAQKIAASGEIKNYMKYGPYALPQLRRDVEEQNGVYGLPPKLYGVKVLVEDANKVTSKRGATRASSFIWPSGSACLISKKGGLEGQYEGKSFSTVQLYHYEEWTVETFQDPRNRRTETHVVRDDVTVLSAPAAGFLITSIIG